MLALMKFLSRDRKRGSVSAVLLIVCSGGCEKRTLVCVGFADWVRVIDDHGRAAERDVQVQFTQ